MHFSSDLNVFAICTLLKWFSMYEELIRPRCSCVLPVEHHLDYVLDSETGTLLLLKRAGGNIRCLLSFREKKIFLAVQKKKSANVIS